MAREIVLVTLNARDLTKSDLMDLLRREVEGHRLRPHAIETMVVAALLFSLLEDDGRITRRP